MIHPELIEKLKVITPEEQKIIDGEISIDRSIYMESANDVINSKKFVNAGKLIAMRPHTRFVHFPVHSHDFVEIIYMCSGSTTHIVDGDVVKLNEGELLFLRHSTTNLLRGVSSSPIISRALSKNSGSIRKLTAMSS